jgi:CheY-like chemotaxis protein
VSLNPARLALAIQVMDASSELIAVKDLSGAFVAANRAFRAAASIGERGVSGLTNRDLFGEDGARALTTSEHLAMLAGAAVGCNVPVAWNGEPAVLRVVCSPWTDDGRCQGVVMAASCGPAGGESDGTPVAALASDVGELAHKFNNALTTVVGLADWHLVAGSPEGELREDLQKIRAAATAAEQTAREIQNLTRAAARALVREPVSAPATPPPVTAGSSVLLVDDQPEVRTSLSVMIRTLGYDVHAVESGEAAIAWLDRHQAALVITDFGMPGMDGGQLARTIAARPSPPAVVLLTGWSDGAHDPEPAITRVLPKPLRMAQLREALTGLIGEPPARRD